MTGHALRLMGRRGPGSGGRGRPPRGSLRRIALAVAVVLAAEAALVSLESGAVFAADSGTADVTAVSDETESAASSASSADSVAAALLMARLQGRRIEVLSERAADATTYALPSGELQTETFAGPVRVERDGVWEDIDTSLSDTGASLTPQATAADITVSDGGDTALASVSKGETS